MARDPGDMIKRLSIQCSRSRQATITNELVKMICGGGGTVMVHVRFA